VIQTQQEFNLVRPKEEEQEIYAHISGMVAIESPPEIIANFRDLFIEGVSYKDPLIRKKLESLINDPAYTELEFHNFLTTCCYISIYYWQKNKKASPTEINELVSVFSRAAFSVNKAGLYRKLSRIKNWLNNYKTCEEYLKLKRLIKILPKQNINAQSQVLEEENYSNQQDPNLIGNIIQRYPYLYESYLLTERSSNEARKTIQLLRRDLQRAFELSLAQYMTDKLRSAAKSQQPNQERSSLTQNNDLLVSHTAVGNPTLLSDRELDLALRNFVVEIQSGYTYKSLAKSFLDRSKSTSSFKEFKEDLYKYLIFGIDPKYGKHNFNSQLGKTLQNVLSEVDNQKPNEFLSIRTCNSLLNFLILDPAQPLNYYVFIDLVTNIGATETVGLLLKLLLICPKIKPSIEKRLSILIDRYESSNMSRVPWLVKSLENFQIATIAHFGKADLSYLSLLD
jgi:hypothetical protein